jgi:acyl carrier protein
MKRKDLDEQIVAILSRASMLPPEAFAREKTLDSLGLGSLERIECIMDLEDGLKVELRDEDLWKLRTVGDVLDAIHRAVDDQSGRRTRS